jgi:hypothetical protein
MVFILLLICTFMTVSYALRPKVSALTRMTLLLLAIGGWVIPYMWILTLIVGALCWATARSPHD